MIDISPDHFTLVKTILKKNVSDCEVRAFGSRYKWLSKPYSDLDLAIVGQQKLDKKLIYKLEEAFEDSELPFRVDVLDWHAISDEFRQIIEQGYEVIQEQEKQLPAGWVVKTLSEIIQITGGGTPKTTKPEYWGGTIPWLSVKDFNNTTRYVYNTEKNITELGLSSSSTKILPKGDIIISARGTVGELAQLGIDMTFNQSCYGIRANNYSLNDFIYYLLKYKVSELKSKSHGSIFDTITRSTFDNLEINLPPLEEQKEIAVILSSLDNKIELNQQINKNLEELAQSIFKEWFIDFNFPDENGNPYRDSGGAMVDSELGQIPASWSVGKLGDYVDIVGGGTPSTKNGKFWSGGTICWSTPKDLSVNKDVFLKDTLKKITDDGVKEIGSGLLPVKTLLLSSRAPIGYSAISNISLAINQGYIAILPTSKLDTLFLYVWLKHNMDKVISMANGSTFQEISKKSFKMINVINYPTEVVEQYLDIISKLFEQVNFLETEILNLQNIRDTLLQKLMSGEI